MKQFFILLLIIMLISCSKNEYNEYEKIDKNGGNEKYIVDLNSFDSEHPEFFDSKLDLGIIFLARQDYISAAYYLNKAEILLDSGSKVENEKKALLYASVAALKLLESNLDEAWKYALKAYNIPKSGKAYANLCGRISLAFNNESEAMKYFDESYSDNSDLWDAESARAYMYLLAKNEDYKKALELCEIYLESGNFFSGLGVFASGLYEKNEIFDKAVFYAFLDYEYMSCFRPTDNIKFLQNLDRMSEELQKQGIVLSKEAENAIQQLKSLYSESALCAASSDFYISKYILCLEKLRTKTFTFQDYEVYISLEKYFKNFPSYYWNLMNVIPKNDPNREALITKSCEKLIMLSSNSVFVPYCREILSAYSGISKEESKKLRLSSEIMNDAFLFIRTGDTKYLEEVYSFLTISDCSYLYDGVTLLRNSMVNEKHRAEFESKKQSAKGRLKDRLIYILS